MTGQIFRKEYPKEHLMEFLDKYAEKKSNYYLLTKISFKKAVYDKSIVNFCFQLKKYYYRSKHKYLDKFQTYRSFMTIIRQICRYHHLGLASTIKYDKSDYEIVYYIYFD